MPQLVQGSPAGRGLEQPLGARVGQPAAAGDRADVARGGAARGHWTPVGKEHRATGAPGDQPRQEPGRAGLEVQDVDRAALAAHPGALVGQVEVLDVEGQHLAGPPSGLVPID